MRRALEARCVSVLSASDGTSGLHLLLDELLGLDVLVTDADLPDRDARSFAELIRRAGGEQDLAIVVLTSGASAAQRAELLALGVDAVIDRARGPEAAARAVMEVVAARRSSREVVPETRAARVDLTPFAGAALSALRSYRWSPVAA